jgi:aspartate 1-decarboxylase
MKRDSRKGVGEELSIAGVQGAAAAVVSTGDDIAYIVYAHLVMADDGMTTRTPFVSTVPSRSATRSGPER